MTLSVLQIGKFYHPYRGGMETYLRDLCFGLKDLVDLKVLVANTRPRTVRESVERVDVIRVASLGRIFSTSVCPSFPRLIRRYAGDINTVHHPNPLAALSYLIARPSGRLTVVYQSDIIKQKITELLYRPFLLKFLRKAEKIVVSSPGYIVGSPVLEGFRGKCVVIPIGIDLGDYEETPEIKSRVEEIRRRHGGRIVLFVGRITLYKGIEYLIKAMENVAGKLLVIGWGERFEDLKMMIISHGMEDKIFLMHQVPRQELLAYLRACAVFCLPSISRNEAFGIVQLEAMASSRPVVSTRLGTGVDYANRDGVTGLLVPPRDVSALENALNRILDNPELGRKMGRRGRLRVEEEFTRQKMAERTYRMYRDLLSQ